MDGAGCAVMLKAKFAVKETFYCGYNDVNDRVIQFLLGLEDAEEDLTDYMIYITDISVNKQVAEYLEYLAAKGLDVRLIDHHKTADWLDIYPWANVDVTKCGTLLTYEHLFEHNKSVNLSKDALKNFAEFVNDYDLWVHADPRSKELNRLFGIIGRDRFVERFHKDPSIGFNELEGKLLEIDDERRERYTDKVAKNLTLASTKEGLMYAYGFADQYVSEVAHELIERLGLDFIALMDPIGRKVSLRSRPEIDVSEIAKVNGGGGHKNAAGFSWDVSAVIHWALTSAIDGRQWPDPSANCAA